MTEEQIAVVRDALSQAWRLGQTYWDQADSEYSSQWKKADVTRAKYDQLVEDTIEALVGGIK